MLCTEMLAGYGLLSLHKPKSFLKLSNSMGADNRRLLDLLGFAAISL
jgi:hypothetical protein